MSVNVDIDVSKFLKSIKLFAEGFPQVMDEAIQEIAQRGAEIARSQKDYVTRGSNGLEKHTQAYRNSAVDQGILADKFYASWVEWGNGPPGSRIYPRSASCLVFMIDGKKIFAKSVKASQPKPFMSKAVSFINSSGKDIVVSHINNFIQGLK